MRRWLALLLLPATALAGGLRHFEVMGTFVPARRAGGTGSVAVNFRALEPDLRVNKTPAPRLNLDLAQTVLVDRQAAAANQQREYDPLTAEYEDLARPLLFPVAIAPTAPSGEHLVKANVVFFYCSQREAWCRRGSADLEILVRVR